MSGNLHNDASKIMYTIMSRGYSKAQAAGIVGNMMQETSLNPKMVACDTNHNYSGGLCMWNAGGLNALMHNDPSNVNNGTYKPIPCNSAAFATNNELAKKLPSASEQVLFLLDSLEKDSILKSWKVKEHMLSTNTPEDAAVMFQDKFERCKREYCHESNRKKFAREFYDNYKKPVPEILNNKTNNGKDKVSDLANGFLHALNRTSNASAVNVEIGIDVNRSNGDTIWLTNGSNNSPKFASVFDMILSAYSNNVSDVKWVISNNSDQTSVPIAYLVTVKENSNKTNIMAVKESNINNPLNLSISKKSSNNSGNESSKSSSSKDASGVHDSFCKALVKKYKTNSNELRSDTFNKIDDYDALFKNYKLEDCNKLLNDMGINNGAVGNLEGNMSNEVTNPKMKKVLSNLNKICVGRKENGAHDYSKGWYDVRKTGGSNPCPSGKCTRGVSTWYNEAGNDLYFWNGPSTAKYSNTTLGSYGMKLVWHGPIESALALDNKNFRPGDISTQYYYKPDGKTPSAHGCMWTGKDWRSDYNQGQQMMAYKKCSNRDGNYSVCIWRHPDFQEPGATVEEVT